MSPFTICKSCHAWRLLSPLCLQPSVDSDDHIWRPALGNNTHTMGGGWCSFWPIRGQWEARVTNQNSDCPVSWAQSEGSAHTMVPLPAYIYPTVLSSLSLQLSVPPVICEYNRPQPWPGQQGSGSVSNFRLNNSSLAKCEQKTWR